MNKSAQAGGPVFPVQRLVGQDYRKTHGRTAAALRRDVLRVAQNSSVISTFECERDHKLAHAVTTMLASGEVIRGPEQYPWVGLRLPLPNAEVNATTGPRREAR